MTQPRPLETQWTVPKPPRGRGGGDGGSPIVGPRPIRVWSVLLAVLLAVLGHATTLLVYVHAGDVLAQAGQDRLTLALAAQGVLALLAIGFGAWCIADVRRDRGFGMGLLGAWAVGFAFGTVPFVAYLTLR
jgi:hypothetical protein